MRELRQGPGKLQAYWELLIERILDIGQRLRYRWAKRAEQKRNHEDWKRQDPDVGAETPREWHAARDPKGKFMHSS